MKTSPYHNQFLESQRDHILMLSIHGVHEWNVVPGLQDTGGQNVFVNQFSSALEKKGYITQKRGDTFTKSSSIVPLSPQAYQVPLVGKIVAGIPVAAEDHVEDFFDLTSLGINNNSNSYFALKVHGDSMINAHILDGDIVVIKKQPRVQNNDITAVLWNGEATIKYLQKKGEQITLVPANNTMQPIPILPENTDSFKILGRVVTVIRHF